MRFHFTLLPVALAVTAVSAPSLAAPVGFFSTERLGYDGTIRRYASLGDAQSASGATDTISVSDRDIGLYFDETTSVAFGSWWFTLDEGFGPGQGRAGWGNTTGNTGVGYFQLYDLDASSTTLFDLSFGGFDGTFYTDFSAKVAGENAGAAEAARLSAIDNVNDGGVFHEYLFDFTLSGLQGSDPDNDGLVTATGEPTGVSGGFSGIFEITENQTSPANQGFYSFDFNLNLDNWAFANSADLTPQVSLDGGQTFFDGTVATSSFGAQVAQEVPLPSTAGLFLAALAGLGLHGFRRRWAASQSG